MTSKRERAKQYRAWCENTRAAAHSNARALALGLAGAALPIAQTYDLGIVLNPGERALHRCPAHYAWRGTVMWTTHHAQLLSSTISRDHTRTALYNEGVLDWLITDQRLTTRGPNREVVSIYWSAIQGVTVDLTADHVSLDGADDYHGELTGPAIAPIAVAAVACCHGPDALLDHPALLKLRTRLMGPGAGGTSPVRLPELPTRGRCRCSSR